MKRSFLTLLLLITATVISFAQQFNLSGHIKDTQGEAISFASIYIKNTTKGTSANIDGIYKFAVAQGTYVVVFKAIGYKPVEKELNITADLSENVVLTPETYTLSGVTISANAEDPAYEIIRQAIKKRRTHLTEVNAYTANVYIKGVQKLVGAPKKDIRP